MPKGPLENFMVEVNDMDKQGCPKYLPDGKILKKKIPMSNGRFADSTEQEFYWPVNSGHELARQFKGMAQILEEWGYHVHELKLKAQCIKKFSNCVHGKTDCCCCCILYNEPDFANVDSILETEAKKCGYCVIFLPKFHCELNLIEQCWGYAKRLYCVLHPSLSEDDLEKNMVKCLEEVPLISMHW
jgi:hypothetical protein